MHGDYRLDNMLFGAPGAERPSTVVDWQTVTWGPAMTDLAYFLGCALPSRTAAHHYDELLRAYHQALGPDPPLTLDDVRDGVRRQSFFGVMMAIVSSMLVERTDRGDEMFMTMLRPALQPRARHRRARRLPEAERAATAAAVASRRGRAHAGSTSRCGTKAGTATSPTRRKASAAGSGWA